MKPKISIIMPAYNEGKHIFKNIRMTRDIMREVGIDTEIVVVDDGSDDNTLGEIERAAQTFENVVTARNPYNMGKGMALRTGFDFSTGDLVVFLDADLDLHPAQIQTLIDVLEMGSYDVVVTSKHHHDSQLDYPWSRKVASLVYYMLIKALFSLPVRDTQTGLKVFRREVLQNVFHRMLVKKFAYDVELLATAVRFGYKVYEIPVVLDFKRDLNWGRIRFEDVVSILIDTLAIFYRLRILKYYDSERPPMARGKNSVLIVVRGCPPTEDVVKRLTIDSNTHIASISENKTCVRSDVMYFPTDEHFNSWIQTNGTMFEIIGFLGAGYLPVGSWVKNAVRNFHDPDVIAVCGPLIPGPFSNRSGKVGALLYSSFLTAGPDNYLYTIKPIKAVKKCFMDNVFIRADVSIRERMGKHGLSIDNGVIYKVTSEEGLLKYDPDVAVSKPIPPLLFPYLKMVSHDAFSKGKGFINSEPTAYQWWLMVPVLIWLFLFTGWMILPTNVYTGFVCLYLLIVFFTGLSCFDIFSAPLFMIGILLEHFIRALSFPAGLLAWILKSGED